MTNNPDIILELIKLKLMKITKLVKCALGVAVLLSFSLVGCEKTDIYSFDAPSDLQSRIDSIAAAKASVDTGDTTYIDIATAIVGAEDYSAAWWAYFSDYFTAPTNKLLHLEFVNHNGGSTNNWNNWNLAIVNVDDRDADDYSEYFLLRSDAYGWGNDDFDLSMVTNDYPDTDGDGDVWNDFRTTMDGAYVTIDVDHSATGNVYVTATAVGTNGTTITETYQQPVSATDDIVAFLVCDASYFEMKQAYLIPSKVTVVEDVNPVAITVTGAPSAVELGDENFWVDAIATVTYADGSSEEVDSTDISFTVIPDMTTLGEKTVIVAYNKTKQGEYCPAVSTYYNLEVTNPVASMVVTTLPDQTTYYYYSSAAAFNTTGLVVTATYSDGTTGVLANETLTFEVPQAEGAQDVIISYVGATATVTTTCPVTVVMGVAEVGAQDYTNGWWTTFSPEYNVPSGGSTVIKMYCKSDNLANWHSPCTILRNTALVESAVVRMDNFGWGTGYEGNANLVATSDWNWDIFTASISNSVIVITVTNNGDNTANIRYDVTYASGETHFQEYAGITVDSADLNCAIVTEESYLVIFE
jgi:hypothetical protein